MSTLQQTGRFRGRQRRGGSLPPGALSAKKIVAQIIDPMDIGATFVDDCAQTQERQKLPSEKCRSKWSHFCGRGFLVIQSDGSLITTAGSVIPSGKTAAGKVQRKGGSNSSAGGQTFENESPNMVLIAATRSLPLALGTGGKRTGGETRNPGTSVAIQARRANAGAGRGPGSQTPAFTLRAWLRFFTVPGKTVPGKIAPPFAGRFESPSRVNRSTAVSQRQPYPLSNQDLRVRISSADPAGSPDRRTEARSRLRSAG
jgi:hypothetical protein